MAMQLPLSDERLAEIKKLMYLAGAWLTHEPVTDPLHIAMRELLFDVEWRREQAAETQAQIERLSERNQELREIVRVVATADNSDSSICYQLCSYVIRWTDDDHQVMTHTAPCVVEGARVALGLDGSGDVTTGTEGIAREASGDGEVSV